MLDKSLVLALIALVSLVSLQQLVASCQAAQLEGASAKEAGAGKGKSDSGGPPKIGRPFAERRGHNRNDCTTNRVFVPDPVPTRMFARPVHYGFCKRAPWRRRQMATRLLPGPALNG